MSYTKILKIIIEIYSFVELDYPGNRTVTVWLKDANVPYMECRHIILVVVISLLFAFGFLPYTLLLLLGYKIYCFSGRKYLRWFNRLKPFLDSYYGPFKIHTRYWTGLLLLVRCALYITFSYNSLRASSKSLMVNIVAFIVIILFDWFQANIYVSSFVNIIEMLAYSNLIVLSAATLAGANSPALLSSLIAAVFVTLMGVIMHHFYFLYVARSPKWLTLKRKFTKLLQTIKNLRTRQTDALLVPSNDERNAEIEKFVTLTTIELREPVLTN